MAWDFQRIRRWSGGVYLAISLAMLVAGVTVLQDRLAGLTFVYYWLICTMFTCLTLMIALLDFRAVRRRSRQEQNELLREVLKTVAAAKGKAPDETEPEK